MKEKDKSSKKSKQLIPNNNYDYSADTDERNGCENIANKITTIKMKKNNINELDLNTAQLVLNDDDNLKYSNSFHQITPQKMIRQNTHGSGNSHMMTKHYALFKGSVVSETTHNSSNNKKLQADTSTDYLEVEE